MKPPNRLVDIAFVITLVLSALYIGAYFLVLQSIELITYSSSYSFSLLCFAVPLFFFSLGILLAHKGIASITANKVVVYSLRACCFLFYVLAIGVVWLQSATASNYLFFASRTIAPSVFLLAGLLEGNQRKEQT